MEAPGQLPSLPSLKSGAACACACVRACWCVFVCLFVCVGPTSTIIKPTLDRCPIRRIQHYPLTNATLH